MQLKKRYNINQGFTLIELLVSIALFSVVLTVTLGSIMTIADSNKKARSLMSVTNNLNFAIDSMVRSFKSGDVKDIAPTNIVSSTPPCFQTFETDYTSNAGDFAKRWVRYCLEENSTTGKGVLTKEVGDETGQLGSDPTELTSPDVDIEKLEFQISGANEQPLLTIILSGTVKVSEKISSNFSIQTSVSQRKLNI